MLSSAYVLIFIPLVFAQNYTATNKTNSNNNNDLGESKSSFENETRVNGETESFTPTQLPVDGHNYTEVNKTINNKDDEELRSNLEDESRVNERNEFFTPTQPSVEMGQIDRNLNSSQISIKSDRASIKKLNDFRPSPQLDEPHYEFNKVPVIPAFPEAKQVPRPLPPVEFPRKSNIPWSEDHVTFTTDQPWSIPVKFPQHHIETSRDRPYNFYNDPSRPDKWDTPSTSFNGNSGYNYEMPNTTQYDKMYSPLEKNMPTFPHGAGSRITVPPGYNKGIFNNFQKSKTGYGIFPEIPSHSMSKTNTGLGVLSEFGEGGGSPWKKIIKILAAVIPIGLLLSALTPNVISVSPMNGTHLRSRAEGTNSSTIKRLLNSISYYDKLNERNCENRIFCELLLSASSSQNAEQHIDNLLMNFTESGTYSEDKIEELKKIFEAVKTQSCNSIRCKKIQEKT